MFKYFLNNFVKTNFKKLSFFFFCCIFFLTFGGSILAQEIVFSPGTAIQMEVDDRGAEEGDIISKEDGRLVRASTSYDENIFGVVAANPVMIIGRDSAESLPIITSGITLVRVDGDYEAIKKGDFITSSENAGVGRKALYPGFVIGRAMEDLESGEGFIEVFVDPRSVVIDEEEPWEEVTFWEAIGRIISAVERDVPQVLRYLLATVFVTASFIFGLYSFSRTLKEGVKGISRNPLAKGSIRFAMILNLIGILVISLSGIALALFVILL